MEYRNYWYVVRGEDSEICGEEFFVAVADPRRYDTTMTEEERNVYNETLRKEAQAIAEYNFPDEEVKCGGWVTDEEAENWGLDTY